MLRCREIAERASDLIDGRLGHWERLQFRLHLAMCVGCRRFVGQMRTVRDLTGSAAEIERLSQAEDGGVAAILALRRQRPNPDA